MKKLIYGTLILALVGIGVVSCEKEKLIPVDMQPQMNRSVISAPQGITVVNGMLKFQDVDHLLNTVDYLDYTFLGHEDAFLAAYPGRTGE